ncbi:hypothetical protein BDA99DRAFT_581547 [Phascolomyces articulosus]|uniref:Enoyl reductase (ER) domain-containing protein n=1 Tax=Phascolomyces articulosus TaxID=60185 RepID=A0AAD5PDI1_9FUNG|nr:hypothetical protein BDA99DRAFT_581547 [Phascolomyces articulosus]
MVAVILTDKPRPNAKGTQYGFDVVDKPVTPPKANEALVEMHGVAFNHRDVWILQGFYPLPIIPGSVLGSDGVGVVKQGKNVGQRVLICPGIGWDKDPRGPEEDYYILGLLPATGTFANEIVVEEADLAPCPEHLSTAEAAALPLSGLTAFRALFDKGEAKKGDNVLITGIGGGVAVYALQFAVAAGINVWVTSSSVEKIEAAKKMGAKGGINYKDANCMEDLKKQLNGGKIQTVVDGAGGPIYARLPEVLASGARMVNYGQTSDKSGNSMTTTDKGGIMFTMVHVFGNYDLRGSTMGSRREFHEMVAFVNQHKIKPLVSKVWKGLTEESVDAALDYMTNGHQQGKLVIEY